jgi:hypothetical protein
MRLAEIKADEERFAREAVRGGLREQAAAFESLATMAGLAVDRASEFLKKESGRCSDRPGGGPDAPAK